MASGWTEEDAIREGVRSLKWITSPKKYDSGSLENVADGLRGEVKSLHRKVNSKLDNAMVPRIVNGRHLNTSARVGFATYKHRLEMKEAYTTVSALIKECRSLRETHPNPDSIPMARSEEAQEDKLAVLQ